MLEKNGIKRKIAIFATFAVVLLIGTMVIPATQGRPDEREPLPEPKPGEEIEISEKRRRQMEATQQMELKEEQLDLPEEEAERIGMDRTEMEKFQEILEGINEFADEGYLQFEEKIAEETNEERIMIEPTEKAKELVKNDEPLPGTEEPLSGNDTEIMNTIMSSCGGSNWYDMSVSWTSTKHEIGLNHEVTQHLDGKTGIITVGALTTLISIKTKGYAAPVLVSAAGIMLSVGLDEAAERDEGCGVVWEFRTIKGHAPPLTLTNLEAQECDCDDDGGGGWWPPWG